MPDEIRETTAKPARAFVAPVVLFEHKGQVAKLTLPDGHRFVAMSHGEAPSLLPIDEPGQYTADVGLAFGDGRGLPVVIATVDLAHVPAWLALPADAVGKIIARTVAETAKRRRGHVRH